MKAFLYTSITCIFLGICIGFSISQKYYMPKPEQVKKQPAYGYTVIDYDSVEWSDGTRTKYDWHYLYKDIAK